VCGILREDGQYSTGFRKKEGKIRPHKIANRLPENYRAMIHHYSVAGNDKVP